MFTDEVPKQKPRKRSSSKRSRSRSKKDRKVSRVRRSDSISSKSKGKDSRSDYEPKERLNKTKKTSFAQAMIKDTDDQENIPKNVLNSQLKTFENSNESVRKEITIATEMKSKGFL